MCVAIGHPELLEDARFVDNTARVAHRDDCVSLLSNIFKSEKVSFWVNKIEQAGVSCGPINKISDVVSDEQVLARNMVVNIPHPNVPDLRVPNSPLKLTETPPNVRLAPPLLGQHNEDILVEMGYDLNKIASLREKGVIGG